MMAPADVPVRADDEAPGAWARRVYACLVQDPYGTGYFDDEALGLAYALSGQAVGFPGLDDTTRETLQDVRRIIGAAVRTREADRAFQDALAAVRARQAEAAGRPDIPGGARVPVHPRPPAPGAPDALATPAVQVSRPAQHVTGGPVLDRETGRRLGPSALGAGPEAGRAPADWSQVMSLADVLAILDGTPNDTHSPDTHSPSPAPVPLTAEELALARHKAEVRLAAEYFPQTTLWPQWPGVRPTVPDGAPGGLSADRRVLVRGVPRRPGRRVRAGVRERDRSGHAGGQAQRADGGPSHAGDDYDTGPDPMEE